MSGLTGSNHPMMDAPPAATAERTLDLVPPRVPSELRFLFEPADSPLAASRRQMRRTLPYRTMRRLTWSLLRLAVRAVAAHLLEKTRRASPVLFTAYADRHGGSAGRAL